MAAISKADLVALEREHGLSEDGMTYQQRLSRISKIQKGEPWGSDISEKNQKAVKGKPKGLTVKRPDDLVKEHELFGKRLILTPMMTPDKNRALYFDEPVGPDIEVEEMSAGQALWGAADDVDRMVGDYKVVRKNDSRKVIARTSIPKVGQEISFEIGTDLVPVVRGNDGQRGYIWSLPSQMYQVGNTMIQIHGLKRLITHVHPELLPQFSGKPVMMYVDGLVLAASIPQTEAILKAHRRKELQDAKLGLV